MFCTEAATTHVSIREIVQSLKWIPYNVDNSPVPEKITFYLTPIIMIHIVNSDHP